MKKFSLFMLCVFVGVATQAQPKKFISTKEKQIIGTDGKEFLIRGTNLGNWLVPEGYMFKFKKTNSPRLINQALTELIGPGDMRIFWQKYLESYITSGDIHYLKSLGMNSIRVPFNYRLFTDQEYLGGRGEKRAFELFDKLIGWCKTENLYVLLDMHCAPGGQTGDNIDDGDGYPFLFDDEKSQDQVISIWKNIANHYKDEPIILGYDLLNEPIATYFDSAHFNPLLEPLYKKIVMAIREVDPNHLIFLGGSQWDSNFKPFGAPFDSKLVYTFHKYWTSPTIDVIQPYIDFRDKFNVPIYAGETGENEDSWNEKFRKLLEQNDIGWHFWPYKKVSNKRGVVTFDLPEGYDAIIQYADTTRSTFADIRKVRPKDISKIRQALDGFLINCRFQNCKPNLGYIKSLGLNAGK
ncbi:MAG: glycosyl hydrolase family 5 [Bacteroidetes bacterium]|nr:MAG: glycosyl hydrolase family 5 [Bacteroidota bacterium]